MMAKLNGASALPPEAQQFLTSYRTLLEKMPEPEASEATIAEMYKAYYGEMGGGGSPPDVKAQPQGPVTDNVTAFKRPAPPKPKAKTGPDGKPRLPVALIFAALVVVYVGVRYYLR
jgi:hypothetical protein